MSKKIEFVKPILQVDKFFKVSDHLIKADDYELVQLGRAMRKAYENQMIEMEVEDEVEKESMDFQKNEAELEAMLMAEKEKLMSDLPQDRMKQWQKIQPLEEQLARNEKEIRDLGSHLQNPAECKTGVCD